VSKAGERSSIGLLLLAVLVGACSSSTGTSSGASGGSGAIGPNGAGGQAGAAGTLVQVGATNNQLDLLFVVDDGSSTGTAQQKLVEQVPALLQALQAQVGPSLDLHAGVVSTDMGIVSDVMSSIGCSMSGDGGSLQLSSRTTSCTASSLPAEQSFLSSAPGAQNFSGSLSDALRCILPLGQTGCGFKQTLGSLARSLGADGAAGPAANSDFLRTDAALAIVILTTEDDCSVPSLLGTRLFSLNGAPQSVTNPLGPIATYRCNRYGHLCTDPATGQIGVMPPLAVPADATGTPPSLALTSCVSNDTTGMLTPVSQLIAGLRAKKVRPDDQVFVGSIVAPASPYGVVWTTPYAGATTAQYQNELWPSVQHSCGPAGGDNVNPSATQTTTDASFGDPAVRIAQFAEGFPRHIEASICDPTFAASMQSFGAAIGAMTAGTRCVPDGTPLDGAGQPTCTVVQVTASAASSPQTVAVPNCASDGGAAPCWTALDPDAAACTGSGGSRPISVSPAPSGTSVWYNVTCSP